MTDVLRKCHLKHYVAITHSESVFVEIINFTSSYGDSKATHVHTKNSSTASQYFLLYGTALITEPILMGNWRDGGSSGWVPSRYTVLVASSSRWLTE